MTALIEKFNTVDHAKANLKKINLITDQSIHIMQIVITFCLWIAVKSF